MAASLRCEILNFILFLNRLHNTRPDLPMAVLPQRPFGAIRSQSDGCGIGSSQFRRMTGSCFEEERTMEELLTER